MKKLKNIFKTNTKENKAEGSHNIVRENELSVAVQEPVIENKLSAVDKKMEAKEENNPNFKESRVFKDFEARLDYLKKNCLTSSQDILIKEAEEFLREDFSFSKEDIAKVE
jgi:hypothetical protein